MSSPRAAKPDRAQFERTVREHHAAVYAAALRITRDEALALDATQQVFVRVLEGKLELDAAVDLQRWLRCAAAREALMVLRAARTRRAREEQHAMQRHERIEDLAGETADTARAVSRALAELPEDLRCALTLRFQEELTFAEIGGVLAISEPSAHQRVQRGLDKLRDKLTRLGLAALTPDLANLLKREEFSRAAPAGLEGQLLSLTGASAGAMSTLAIGAALATVIAGLAAWGVMSWPSNQTPREVARSTAAAPPAVDSTSRAREFESASTLRTAAEVTERESAPSGSNTTVAALANGSIEGVVVDEFGLPLEGVDVLASSRERHSKLAEFSGQTKSARDGSFRLSLPVTLESGQDYSLVVSSATYRHDAGVHRVRPARACAHQRIEFARDEAPRPGAWQLRLTVRASNGAAIEGAIARLHWSVRDANGALWSQQQAGGECAADGALTLHGDGLGRKLLTIDARAAGFAPLREAIELEREGVTLREVVLERGVELAGTLVDELGAPISAARFGDGMTVLYAVAADRNEWFVAHFPEPGRFVIPALAATPHELRFQHERWSSFTIAGLTPGAKEVRIQLKLKGDTSDVGEHRGELHGELLDAETGAAVPASGLATWLERIPDDSPALVDGDWAPLVMERVIVQTAMGMTSGVDLPPAPPENAFIYDDLEPGRYAVRVHASGYAPTLIGPVELSQREIVSGLRVRLSRGANVSGVVRDALGSAVAGARVLAAGDGGLSRAHVARADSELRSSAGRGFVRTSAAATDEQGRFSLANVPTDRALRLHVLHPAHEPSMGAWLELRESASSSFELRAGAPRER